MYVGVAKKAYVKTKQEYCHLKKGFFKKYFFIVIAAIFSVYYGRLCKCLFLLIVFQNLLDVSLEEFQGIH